MFDYVWLQGPVYFVTIKSDYKEEKNSRPDYVLTHLMFVY